MFLRGGVRVIEGRWEGVVPLRKEGPFKFFTISRYLIDITLISENNLNH